ncbi:hypothetical protein ACYFX5_22630 [Bremerella sp. T1]|uniref:hypothetical protein n=1 Tax=Bremerella sp. TYQ1 TaxID=3119568 RepID=UPI001CC8EEFD|nr:hypothetical protein [Bremerella volcania]UBM35832.1 hypothetical protein LA756_24570 [Bremerella volcania]
MNVSAGGITNQRSLLRSRSSVTLLLSCMAVLLASGWCSEAFAQSGTPTSETTFTDPRYLLDPQPMNDFNIRTTATTANLEVQLQQYFEQWSGNLHGYAVYNRYVTFTVEGIGSYSVPTNVQGRASLYLTNLPLNVTEWDCSVIFPGGGAPYNGVVLDGCSATFQLTRSDPF